MLNILTTLTQKLMSPSHRHTIPDLKHVTIYNIETHD